MHIKPIAFYLPQYHPIPENDKWWGKGFTEWTNVTKAVPLFKGHYQPRLPADLGFYDLRLSEARVAQAKLAKKYGVYGFCYYHYWFAGKRLLEKPFEDVLRSGVPDFPFCLCWANENWCRTWDGRDNEILFAQNYTKEDWKDHIDYLLTAFKDKRYIRVDGKPIFLIYRASAIPDLSEMLHYWRYEAKRSGIDDIYFCKVESIGEIKADPRPQGFSAAVEFSPDKETLKSEKNKGFLKLIKIFKKKFELNNKPAIYDYSLVVARMLGKKIPAYPRFPCVTPSWDNTPRKGIKGSVFVNGSPALFRAWVTDAAKKYLARSTGPSLLFINAWNEWAEGNHLEPCQKNSTSYLEALREAIIELEAFD